MDDLRNIAVSNAVAALILALAAIVVGAVSRRPAVRHGLWLLVLLKLVTPPLLRIPLTWSAFEPVAESSVPIPVETPSADEPTPRDEPTLGILAPAPEIEVVMPETPLASDVPTIPAAPPPTTPMWPQVLSGIWLAGTAAWFLLAVGRLYRFCHLLRFARPAPKDLQARAGRLAQTLGLRRCPILVLLPGRIAPMVWGSAGSPRLIVPAELIDVLSEEQLDTLIVHELAHLRRRDHWVRVLEFVVVGLYWWHPVVWLACRELREAEEQCCDAWVVSTLPEAGRTYAEALLDTLDFLSTTQSAVPPLASGLGQVADLKRRLTMIMRGNTPRSLTWPGCLVLVVLGLTVLPMLPALHGQAPGKEEERQTKTDADAAKELLEKAHADLQRQKKILEQKMAEVAAAEARLRQLTLRYDKQLLLERRAEASEAAKKGTTDNLATYRIEITLPADGGMKADEIVEKIRALLPEKSRVAIVFRPVAVVPNVVTVPRPPVEIRKEWSVIPSTGQLVKPPTPTNVITLPTPMNGPISLPATGTPDKRINDLEKKLEKVLQELHDMKKQMKERHPSSAAPPTSNIPAATAAVPPETVPVPTPRLSPISPTPPTPPVADPTAPQPPLPSVTRSPAPPSPTPPSPRR